MRSFLTVEPLEDRFMPSGINPAPLANNWQIPPMQLPHPNVAGKTAVLADPGGNSVGTVHIDQEDANGNFTGTFESSVFHLKNALGGSVSVQISGVVGATSLLGLTTWSHPSITFHGSATGFVLGVQDTQTVNFQGALSWTGQNIIASGTFDESDFFVTVLGNITTRTHADVSGTLT